MELPKKVISLSFMGNPKVKICFIPNPKFVIAICLKWGEKRYPQQTRSRLFICFKSQLFQLLENYWKMYSQRIKHI